MSVWVVPQKNLQGRAERGASLIEYLLITSAFCLVFALLSRAYVTPAKIGTIQTACIIETGGGTAGTVGDNVREGTPEEAAMQERFLMCVQVKMTEAGLNAEAEENRGTPMDVPVQSGGGGGGRIDVRLGVLNAPAAAGL